MTKTNKKKSTSGEAQSLCNFDCNTPEPKREVWRPVKGYEGRYYVSSYGRIYSRITGKVLKPCIVGNGYASVELFDADSNSKRFCIHRLVAAAFLPVPDANQVQVNHKNENKLDNKVSNLEWCTAKYNMNYGTCKERRKESMALYWASDKHREDKRRIGQRTKELLGQRVLQITKTGQIVKEFISVNEAGRVTGIKHISEVCNGKRKTAGGYVWTFKGGVDLSVSEF